MSLGIGIFGVEITADDLQSPRVHRNSESDGVVRFVWIARPVGIDQNFIRNRRQSRQRAQAAYHGAFLSFADNVQNQVGILLFADSLGAVVILIGQRMGQA